MQHRVAAPDQKVGRKPLQIRLVPHDEHTLRIGPVGDQLQQLLGRYAAGQRVELGVRPEHLQPVDPTTEGVLAGEVMQVEDHVRHQLATVAVAGGHVRVVVGAGELVPGQRCGLVVPPDGACLYVDGVLADA